MTYSRLYHAYCCEDFFSFFLTIHGANPSFQTPESEHALLSHLYMGDSLNVDFQPEHLLCHNYHKSHNFCLLLYAQ